jgi:hypothetical protein
VAKRQKKMNEEATIWYQIVIENGVKSGSVISLEMPRNSNIGKLKKLVISENVDLKHIPPRKLKVYSNSADFINSTEGPLTVLSTVAGLGLDEDNPLYVVVPQHPHGNYFC